MKKTVMIALFIITMSISSVSALSEIRETIKEISSDDWTETKKIDFNEYLVYKFHGAQSNTIEVTLEVVRGDSIDTFILNSADYPEFQSMMQSGKSKPFNAYSTGKGMNLKFLTYSFEIPADDTYYIVQDNSYLPNNGGSPGGSVDVKMKFSKTRCQECEETLEVQKRLEEEARQKEEAQRKLQEEMNKTQAAKSTPGFEMIFSVFVLAAVLISVRK